MHFRGFISCTVVLALTATAVPHMALVAAEGAEVLDQLVGTWRLVSATATTESGHVDPAPFGSSPSRLLIYTREGTVSVQVSYGGRSRLSADRRAAAAAERAEAFATFFAYAGRYSVTGNRVVHHVEIASVQNWVGTDLTRVIDLEGARMTLRTPPSAVDGVMRTSELMWERVR